MKKKFAYMGIAALIYGLASCGGQGDVTEGTTSSGGVSGELNTAKVNVTITDDLHEDFSEVWVKLYTVKLRSVPRGEEYTVFEDPNGREVNLLRLSEVAELLNVVSVPAGTYRVELVLDENVVLIDHQGVSSTATLTETTIEAKGVVRLEEGEVETIGIDFEVKRFKYDPGNGTIEPLIVVKPESDLRDEVKNFIARIEGKLVEVVSPTEIIVRPEGSSDTVRVVLGRGAIVIVKDLPGGGAPAEMYAMSLRSQAVDIRQDFSGIDPSMVEEVYVKGTFDPDTGVITAVLVLVEYYDDYADNYNENNNYNYNDNSNANDNYEDNGNYNANYNDNENGNYNDNENYNANYNDNGNENAYNYNDNENYNMNENENANYNSNTNYNDNGNYNGGEYTGPREVEIEGYIREVNGCFVTIDIEEAEGFMPSDDVMVVDLSGLDLHLYDPVRGVVTITCEELEQCMEIEIYGYKVDGNAVVPYFVKVKYDDCDDNYNYNGNANYNDNENYNYNGNGNFNYNDNENYNMNYNDNTNYNDNSNANGNGNYNYNENGNYNDNYNENYNENANYNDNHNENYNANYNANENYNENYNENENYNGNMNYNDNYNDNREYNENSNYNDNENYNANYNG